MAKGDDSGIGSGGGGASTGGGNGPVGTPQNPAPNGYTGPVDGKDISDTWQPPRKYALGYEQIESVMDAQGFRGKPKLITDQAEFDKAAAAAWGGAGMVMIRGIGAPDNTTLQAYKDSLYEGDWYVSCGGGAAHGYGQYAAYTYGATKVSQRAISEAKLYASGNGPKTTTFTMTLDPSAKIGEESQLKSSMNAHNSMARSQYRTQRIQAASPLITAYRNGTAAERDVARQFENGVTYPRPSVTASQYKKDFNRAWGKVQQAMDAVKEPNVYSDVGVYAAAKGYDFYYDRRSGYSVTLNRTKLIIKV